MEIIPEPHRSYWGVGYDMDVSCNLANRQFTSAVATVKTRRVKGIHIRIQHPMMLRFGRTHHDLIFRTWTDDLSLIEINVRARLENIYESYMGLHNWENGAGGLREAIVQHWSLATPTREVFIANLQ